MARHVREEVVLYLLLGRGLAVLQDYAGAYLLAERLVGHADDLNVLDLRVRVEELLELLRVDVLSAADNHVLQAARYLVVAVGRAAGEVSRVEPAVFVDGRGGRLGHLVVALHYIVAARDELAVNIVGHFLVRLGVYYAAFDFRQRVADRLDAHLERISRVAHRAARRGLGLSVDYDDFLHVHLVDDVAHLRYRAGASSHDSRAHVGEVRLCEVLMLHHRDEHRRHAVEAGDVLLVDAGERGLRREVRQRRERRAVRHRGRHREHHAEAVEHRHLYHHAVLGREVHAVADAFAVVDDVVVREHDALREAGRAARVLHVADVVDVDGGGEAVDLLERRHVRARDGLFPREAALHAEVHGDYVAQEWQAAASERLAGRRGLQLGAEFFHNLVVMRIAVALDHDERVRVGLAQQVLGLVDFVGGVDRYEHRADFRRRPEGQVPLRKVRRPYRHVAAGPDAERDESARELVHVVAELGVGARVVQRRVLEGVLVGEFLDYAVEHLREGLFDKFVLLPRVEPLAALALVEALRLHHARGAAEAAHCVDEVQRNQLEVRDVGHPLWVPFERDEAVVVQRVERAHHRVDGQAALADEAVFDGAVYDFRVFQMHVLDVGAEVLDRLFRRFAGVAEGVLQIPERRKVVAGVGIEHLAEPVGVGEYADGLDEQRHARFLRAGQHRVEHGLDGVALLFVALARVLRAEADVWNAQPLRGFDVFSYLGAVFLKGRRVGDVVPRVYAGYRKARLGHLAVRGVRHRGVEDAGLFRELRLVYVVYLYSRKAAVLRDLAEILPCVVVPPEGGK